MTVHAPSRSIGSPLIAGRDPQCDASEQLAEPCHKLTVTQVLNTKIKPEAHVSPHLSVEGLLITNPRQSAIPYVGFGVHQARLMTGMLKDGRKVYFLEGPPQAEGTYRRLLRNSVGDLIGDGRAAKRRLREMIQYQAIDRERLFPLHSATAISAAAIFENTWFYYILNTPNQRVFYLTRIHDWFSRVVVDSGSTALQPASFVVKSSLADLQGWRPTNVAIRVESNVRSRWGTAIQMGTDVSNQETSKQLEYARAGAPIMDVISIQTAADFNYAGYRAEISAQSDSPLRLKFVARDALAAGGSVSWRRMWLDPQTMRKRSTEITLVMKAEGSVEYGASTQAKAIEGKAEIEIQVRVIDPSLKALSFQQTQQLLAHAVRWGVEMGLMPGRGAGLEAPRAGNINTLNAGSRDQARLVTTLKLHSGTPVWDLVPSSKGKNFGHPTLDLANTITWLLIQAGKLAPGTYLRNYQDARDRLISMWAEGTPAQRRTWAQRLRNSINVNFGLTELAEFNRAQTAQHGWTQKDAIYRRWFLE